VTVPPETDTFADSRGRCGSGGAYAVGHGAIATDAELRGTGVALGLAVGAVATAVDVALGRTPGDPVDDGPSALGVDVLQPASSAASTSHDVRTLRR
jgi:hypothetical protein